MWFQKTVPNNTKKKITTRRHTAEKNGSFLSAHSTKITMKKTTNTMTCCGSIVCGYASNNIMT